MSQHHFLRNIDRLSAHSDRKRGDQRGKKRKEQERQERPTKGKLVVVVRPFLFFYRQEWTANRLIFHSVRSRLDPGTAFSLLPM